MKRNRSIPDAAVIPVLKYADVREAAAWLVKAFGFRERLRIFNHRIQMTTELGGALVVADGADEVDSTSHTVMVRVSDARAHCETARAAGALIQNEPEDHPYGECQYSALDIGGHRWTFSETIADADPAEWGGELVSDD
jgi:uncharacterized glyoxalase superfamily protein PhnB